MVKLKKYEKSLILQKYLALVAGITFFIISMFFRVIAINIAQFILSLFLLIVGLFFSVFALMAHYRLYAHRENIRLRKWILLAPAIHRLAVNHILEKKKESKSK